MQKVIRNNQKELTQFIINDEKIKQSPNQNKINKAHQHLHDIENYKTTV